MNIQRVFRSLTLRQLLGILVAVSISTLIIVFANEIRKLESLGYAGVFLLSLLGNATMILPAPALAFVFVLGATLSSPLLVGILAGTGSALGEMTGYLAGISGSGVIEQTRAYERVHQIMMKYGLWIIFVLAIIPNPLFDIAGLAAGAMKISWWRFLLITASGKILKSLIFAYSGSFILEM